MAYTCYQLMTKEAPAAASDAASAAVIEQLKKTVEELNSALEEKEEISQRCHELDSQVMVACGQLELLCTAVVYQAMT